MIKAVVAVGNRDAIAPKGILNAVLFSTQMLKQKRQIHIIISAMGVSLNTIYQESR